MESSALKSKSVAKDIELFQLQCDVLVLQFEAAESTLEKTRIADEYGRAFQQLEASQVLLDLLRKRELETEEKAIPAD
jgi:hypothetical protein